MTIRRTPTDFIVEERLTDAYRAQLRAAREPGGAAPHAVYSLTKTSLTTPDALHHFSVAIKIKSTSIDYAGLKDKHAHTTQHVSIHTLDRSTKPLPPTISGHNWSANLIGWSPAPLAADAIAANRFTIVIRDLARETSSEMDRRAALLTDPAPSTASPTEPRRLLIANYFGAQRFGSARHGKGFVATHLIRGEFEHALRLAIGTPARKDAGKTRTFSRLLATKWGQWQELAAELPRTPERRAIELLAERSHRGTGLTGTGLTEPDFRDAFAQLPYFQQTMCVEAFQSQLWNEIAHRLVARLCTDHRPLKSDDQFGEMLFPPAHAITPAARALSLPLLSPKTTMIDPWQMSAINVLAEHQLTLDKLQIPGLRRPFFGEANRPFIVAAANFSLTAPEPDDLSPGTKRLKRTAAFELRRGAYATVVLRAIGQ